MRASDPRSLAKSVAVAEGLATFKVRNTSTTVAAKSLSIDELERKLKATLTSMKEVHTSHVKHLARVDDDIEAISKNLPVLRDHLDEANTRFLFVQESRGNELQFWMP